MSKFKMGTYVTTDLNGGMTGEIVGIHSESELTGDFYIIKILDKSTYPENIVESDEKTWTKYPYEYTVLCDKVLKIAPESILAILRSLGKIPDSVTSLEDRIILQNEQEMRDSVKKLKIVDTYLRNFLEKSAKEYIKSIGKKGEILEIYPLDFIARIKISKIGIRHIRVPVADFFEGKSKVSQFSSEMRDTLKKLKPKIVGKISGAPSINPFYIDRDTITENTEQVPKETPTKSKKINKRNKK